MEAAPGVAKPSPPLAGTHAQSPVYGIEEAEAGEEDEDWNEAEEEEEEEETQQDGGGRGVSIFLERRRDLCSSSQKTATQHNT